MKVKCDNCERETEVVLIDRLGLACRDCAAAIDAGRGIARIERMRLLRWLSKRQSAKVWRLEQRIADLLAACELLASADDAMQHSDDAPSDIEAYGLLCEAIPAARAAIAKAKEEQ